MAVPVYLPCAEQWVTGEKVGPEDHSVALVLAPLKQSPTWLKIRKIRIRNPGEFSLIIL